MSVLSQRVRRGLKNIAQAQMVLADTLNQQVTGSIPVRLTSDMKFPLIDLIHPLKEQKPGLSIS